jgi:hypothetical protein
MERIAIVYICTGKYNLFWEDFFKTFEEKFLENTEKHYFVFTEQEHIYGEDLCDRVHRKYLEAKPWPLITLLRFHTFCSVEDELRKFDYIYFFNSNVICKGKVLEQEFLPDKSKGERIAVTSHPGYFRLKSRYVGSYDRNPKSKAYVPYNVSGDAVIGALIGGTSEGFLEMSRTLKARIDNDLQRGVIAKWHDESHLNRYIIGRNDYKLLSPSFYYPERYNLDFVPKIVEVEKSTKFDVNQFKGNTVIGETFGQKVRRNLNKIVKEQDIYYLRDKILNRKVNE